MGQGKVILGISGGVDSAVTGWMLKKSGYDVHAVFMQNWDDEQDPHCTASEDLSDARRVCDQLGLPLATVNFSEAYWQQVFSLFLDAHAKGLTPNPDVLCNQEIKFKCFLDYALAQGADKIATGHYARIEQDEQGEYQLLKGIDEGKDQSYFLCRLNQHQLAHSLFPLGEYKKTQIREFAQQLGLDNADKKDSTGICFVGERRFQDFLKQYLLAQPGPIEDLAGQVLGEHQGLMFYTLGQRKGIGVGGTAEGDEAPWYVVAKDTAHNTLKVAQGHDHPQLFSMSLVAADFHWVARQAPSMPLRCLAKTRYRQPDQACEVVVQDDGRIDVRFEQPQRAVTPGQYVVLYQGAQCLGGGVIESAAQLVFQ